MSNNKTKKPFLKTVWGTIILYIIVLFIAWGVLYLYFNYVPIVKDKACFRFLGVTYGCIPEVLSAGRYYEKNTEIKLSEEFVLSNDSEAEFYIKNGDNYLDKVSFSEEGEQEVELYVKYMGKMTKHNKIIKIGDAIPPVVKQKSIPKVHINDVIVIEDYLDIKDDRDPNPRVLKNSIVALEAGEFELDVWVTDNHDNKSVVTFKYEVIAYE